VAEAGACALVGGAVESSKPQAVSRATPERKSDLRRVKKLPFCPSALRASDGWSVGGDLRRRPRTRKGTLRRAVTSVQGGAAPSLRSVGNRWVHAVACAHRFRCGGPAVHWTRFHAVAQYALSPAILDVQAHSCFRNAPVYNGRPFSSVRTGFASSATMRIGPIGVTGDLLSADATRT
jgi:hypothetical protein